MKAPAELTELGRARRRLNALLAASGLGGATSLAEGAAVASARPGVGLPQTLAAQATTGRWVHGFAAYGAPKYGPDFTHFEYVNPNAPKGGTIKLRNPDRRSSFDKFNPWTVRGNAPAGVMIWMVEGLAHLAQDEPLTMYGLLAEAIFVAPDFSSVSFRLRPQARFNNGDAVTPQDVVYSLTLLKNKGAQPDVQTRLEGITRAVVVDERTVRFEMKDKSREQAFIAGTLPVFSKKWGAGKALDEIVAEPPITAGPYLVDRVNMPRSLSFKRNPHYWAQDLPVRRGHFNFERVVYRNYTDDAVAREAFKAGEFDLYKEYRGRAWLRQHKGPKWDDGRIVKAALHTRYGAHLQSYNLNLRRPKFQDIRVREALGYSLNFEGSNKTGLYLRASSEFNNSDFAAQGLPGPGELKLLEPFRADLPPRVFGPPYVAPRTDDVPDGLRRNLLKARVLLEQAGWTLDGAGVLRNAQGEPFEIEYLEPLPSNLDDWRRNLLKLGIKLTQRVVDYALFNRRLVKYDFDMVTIAEPTFTLPQGSDLAGLWGSKAADEEGNNNYRGVKSRAVDALIDALNTAGTMDELRNAARALDRVVMWNFWQVPDLYHPVELFSHWNRFGKPAVQAHYFSADFLIYGFIEHGPWPLWTWWDKSLPAQPGVKG